VLAELQEKYKRNALKQFYEGICKIRTGFQPRTTMRRNKRWIILGSEEDASEVWTANFKELLNPQVNTTAPEETTYFVPECNIAIPTLQETLEIIRNLKNNRAPGEDLITSELIKYGRRKLWNRIHQLIKTIWNTEEMPQE
jgi:hypothetical protein